jgi:hypothetical protein
MLDVIRIAMNAFGAFVRSQTIWPAGRSQESAHAVTVELSSEASALVTSAVVP